MIFPTFSRITDFLRLPKKGITVYAFYGPSGTGKSYRAKFIAQKLKARALIDDGLLIQDERIIAGKSAKLEQNYMGAVRVALFDDKEHRDGVAKAILSHHIKRILVLGTSEKMILKITTRLQLPPPVKYIRIEDVATPEEMDEAKRSRQIEGKHVIPVRSYEIRQKDKSYSKIFVDSIRIAVAKKPLLAKLFGIKQQAEVEKAEGNQQSKLFEKSIVRPAFSIYARKNISHASLARLTLDYTAQFDSEIRMKKLSIKNGPSGYTLTLTADMPFNGAIADMTQKMKDFVIKMIETETGVLIEELFIVVDKMLQPRAKPVI